MTLPMDRLLRPVPPGVPAPSDHDPAPRLPAPGAVLAVVLATRNEASSVGPVLSEIREAADILRHLVTTTVLVVDDSTDGSTVEVIHGWAERLELDVEVVPGHHQGLGAAVIDGLRCAVRTWGDRLAMVANLDADGQHDARELPLLVRAALGRDLDIVIGSRWVKGGRSYGTSRFRTLGSKLGNAAFRSFTGVREVRDATTSFRVYSRAAAEHITRQDAAYPSGYAFFSSIIADADSVGLRLGEVPITFRSRYEGESKLTTSEAARFFRSLPAQRRARREPIAEADPTEYRAREELDQLASADNWHRWILDAVLAGETTRPGPRTVLEVGAGTGTISSMLRERWPGATIVSVEPDTRNFGRLLDRSFGDDRWIAHHGTLADWVAAPSAAVDRFDRIMYVNVLEHIENPLEEIALAGSLLSEEGSLHVFVPAGERLFGPIDRKSGHFRRYTKQTVTDLVRRCGMEVEAFRNVDRLGVVPYWVLYRLLMRSTLSTRNAKMFDRLYVPTAMQVDGLVPASIPGKNVVVQARRNQQPVAVDSDVPVGAGIG
jgi:dolichol-phosphate mannosyltransferase